MNNTRETGASDNLEFSAQLSFGLKVAAALAVVAAAVIGVATFFIWVSPYWAKWF